MHSQLRNKHFGALVQLVRIHACHAWGHGFESRTHRQPTSASLSSQGALVQLVRIHACHAWGHGFESRTHRKTSETNKSLRVTKPTKSMICELFLFYYRHPEDKQTPRSDKVALPNRYRETASDYCNDFHANSLICPLLSQFCLLIIH